MGIVVDVWEETIKGGIEVEKLKIVKY